ncbi:hypothetical protein [Streptomyces sulphureus]|uniref:hypothetical protein n=1 Tax=Streptomyces sulphureus TaxID=47758 RepID=UPI00037E638F|nr:hypothetical protein [Streptomyces sulphureus]
MSNESPPDPSDEAVDTVGALGRATAAAKDDPTDEKAQLAAELAAAHLARLRREGKA